MRWKPLLLAVVLLLAGPASASAGPGFGFRAGLATPAGGDTDFDTGVAFGYHCDLPLFDSFYISPFVNIYAIEENGRGPWVVDAGVQFKFVIVTRYVRPFLGAALGITPIGESLYANLGPFVGLHWPIVSNFGLVWDAKYNLVLGEGRDLRSFQTTAGIEIEL